MTQATMNHFQQLSFFDSKDKSIQEKFEIFHASHPEVYDYLVLLALDLKNSCRSHYGIGALFERARWHFDFELKRDEPFKLNNVFRSRYVRKMIAEYPVLEGFFELRELKAK